MSSRVTGAASRCSSPSPCASTPLAAQQGPCAPSTPLGPSRDLYCIELVAAPGMEGAAGTVELGHVPGPFTVAVTAEGLPAHRLVLDVSGLPAPSSLGRFTHLRGLGRASGDAPGAATRRGDATAARCWATWTWRSSSCWSRPSATRGCASPTGKRGASGPVAQHATLPAGSPRVLHRPHGNAAGREAHRRGCTTGSEQHAAGRTVPMPPGARDAPGRDGAPPRGQPVSSQRATRPPRGPRELVRLDSGDTLPPRGRTGPAHPQGAQLHDVRVQRPVSRPAARGGARVGGHRRLHATGCRSRPRCTGTASGSTPQRRRAGTLTAAGAAGRRFTYRLRFPDAGSTGITRTCARTSSRSSGSTAT